MLDKELSMLDEKTAKYLLSEDEWTKEEFWQLNASEARQLFMGVKNVDFPVAVLRKEHFEVALACVNCCIKGLKTAATAIEKPASLPAINPLHIPPVTIGGWS